MRPAAIGMNSKRFASLAAHPDLSPDRGITNSLLLCQHNQIKAVWRVIAGTIVKNLSQKQLKGDKGNANYFTSNFTKYDAMKKNHG